MWILDKLVIKQPHLHPHPDPHPDQADRLTENDSWMCPECQDKGKAAASKPDPPKIETKKPDNKVKEAKPQPAAKKKEVPTAKKAPNPVPPKKNLALAEKLKAAATEGASREVAKPGPREEATIPLREGAGAAGRRRSADSARRSGGSRRSSTSDTTDFSSREATPSIIR